MAKTSLKERMKKRRAQIAENSGRGSYKVFTFKEGTTRVRPVPVPQEVEPGIEVLYIFISKEIGGIVSPATWGDKCAFNEKALKLKDSREEADKKLAKKVKPKTKYLMPCIRYKDEDGEEVDMEAGIKPALLTPGQYQDAIDLWLDEKEAGDFTNADSGYDLKVSRTGSGLFDTEYSLRACKATRLHKKFRGTVTDPEQLARALTPTYEQTKEYLKSYLNNVDLDDEPKPNSKNGDRDKSKKRKKNRKGDDLPF